MLQKHKTLFENSFRFLKRPINSNEKTPTAPSYKMPEAKKTNTFIEKQNQLQKSNDFHWKTILDDKKT